MPSSIGLRVYRVFITKEGDTTPSAFVKDSPIGDPYVFIHNYLTNENLKIANDITQRSWHIENVTYASNDARNYYGIVRYGMYGFESTLVDNETANVVHERKQNHSEVIPLVFHAWAPEDCEWAYLSMQSFQGRSCVTVVQEPIAAAFKVKHKGWVLRFVKISPGDGEAEAFYDKQVREVRLIKKSSPTDLTDVYTGKTKLSSAKHQLSITASRNNSLGTFGAIKGLFKSKQKSTGGCIIEYDGDEFDEVTAEVRLGKKTKIVGVYGYNNDVGVIDITNDILFDDGGHPTIDSVYNESNEILLDIHTVLKTKK